MYKSKEQQWDMGFDLKKKTKFSLIRF